MCTTVCSRQLRRALSTTLKKALLGSQSYKAC